MEFLYSYWIFSCTRDFPFCITDSGHAIKQAEAEPLTVKQACDSFTSDAEARHLRIPSPYKYRLLFRQLQEFTTQRGFRYLADLALDYWRDFRASLPNKNVTALKELG